MDFNILNFFDTPKAEKLLENMTFTPAQQILLIGCSKKRTALEKVEALEYLLSRYTKEEVDDGSVIKRHRGINISFYQNTVNLVKIWRDLLNMRDVEEGVIYTASLKEIGSKFDKEYDYLYFSSYEKAYQFLQEEKLFSLQLTPEKMPVTGVIKRIELDDESIKGADEYWFDDNLRLCDLRGRDERYSSNDGIVLSFSNFIFYEQHVQMNDMEHK